MTGWLIGNMAWASLLLVLVLAIRAPFAHALGAGPAYALWAIPALRLVAPPLPAWGIAMPDGFHEPAIVWVGGAVSAATSPPAAASWSWTTILLAIWLAGIAVFAAWQWRSYRALLTRLSFSSRSIGAHRGLPVIESGAVQGPLALGLLDRRIIIPLDFGSRYTPDEQALALAHEAIHHRRGDIWWNFAALAFLALNWFNPLAWIAFRAFRADQELACDAAVTAGASGEARSDYAQAMVKSASPARLIAVSPLNHADQLKRRLKMMARHRRSPTRALGGAMALTCLAASGFVMSAPGLAQNDEGGGAAPGHERQAAPGSQRAERRIILTDRRPGLDDSVRIRVLGLPHTPDCEVANAVRLEESQNGQRTRIMLCASNGADPAQRTRALETALERLESDEQISAETRARLVDALNREIAQLRDAR